MTSFEQFKESFSGQEDPASNEPTEELERDLIIQDLERDYEHLKPRDIPHRDTGLQSDFRSPMGH